MAPLMASKMAMMKASKMAPLMTSLMALQIALQMALQMASKMKDIKHGCYRWRHLWNSRLPTNAPEFLATNCAAELALDKTTKCAAYC